jgi:hypothetical protein
MDLLCAGEKLKSLGLWGATEERVLAKFPVRKNPPEVLICSLLHRCRKRFLNCTSCSSPRFNCGIMTSHIL